MEDEELFTNDKQRRFNFRSFAFLHHRSVILAVLALVFMVSVLLAVSRQGMSFRGSLTSPQVQGRVEGMAALKKRLGGLKRLLDDGLITEDDFKTQKQMLLSKFAGTASKGGKGHPVPPSSTPDPEDIGDMESASGTRSDVHKTITIHEKSPVPAPSRVNQPASPSSAPDPEDMNELPDASPAAPAPRTAAAVTPKQVYGGVGADGLFVQMPSSNFTPRQKAVRDAYIHAWDSYKAYAWGFDELKPVAQSSITSFELALTMIDGLDTLYVMGENERFNEACEWIGSKLALTRRHPLNVFETTIRVLGGLLSAYTLSGRQELLEKATELGRRLKPAMLERHQFIAHSDVDISNGQASLGMGKVSISEATTLQLEFKSLAHLQENKEYFRMMETCSDAIDAMRSQLPADKRGLVPMFIHLEAHRFEPGSTLTLGARGDSYYEYLLKQWLLTNKEQRKFADRYLEAMRDVEKHLVARTTGPKQYVFVGELMSSSSFYAKMDHLVCFLPGLLALGAFHKVGSEDEMSRHMQLAKDIMRTCVEMYTTTPTGLAPEITHFDMANGDHELYVKPADAHNILRPEVVESLMVLYRVTGDKQYQEWGWSIFQAFERHSRVPGGYSGLQNVLSTSSPRIDKMESFFLAETLKYLFLLFDDTKSILPLDQYVFNTEAHPLRIFSMSDL